MNYHSEYSEDINAYLELGHCLFLPPIFITKTYTVEK